MANDVGRAAHLAEAIGAAETELAITAGHLAENYRRMVAQIALESWRRLPTHTRVWLSPEDMIEDGMTFLFSEAILRWEPKRGKLSTFVGTVIRNFYDEHYYHKLSFSTKRNEKHLDSLEDVAARQPNLSRERALELVLRERHDYKSAQRMQQECFVVPMMLEMYRRSSPALREEIKHWFLEGVDRVQLSNAKFMVARGEFHALAKKIGIGIEDCRHLLTSPSCLDELSRGIRWIPFDIDNPTPKLAL